MYNASPRGPLHQAAPRRDDLNLYSRHFLQEGWTSSLSSLYARTMVQHSNEKIDNPSLSFHSTRPQVAPLTSWLGPWKLGLGTKKTSLACGLVRKEHRGGFCCKSQHYYVTPDKHRENLTSLFILNPDSEKTRAY